MARLARLVVPGLPHLVTQRGNRHGQVFFNEADYELYRDLLAASAVSAGSEVWCYCLMPTYVQMVVVPSHEDGLRRTFAEAHRRYTGFINVRMRTTGHLWQGRFGSAVLDETWLAHALRHVCLNPVREHMVELAGHWPWSSVRAHLAGVDDELVRVRPVLERYGDLAAFLGTGQEDAQAVAGLRQSETTGRPLGSADWVANLEARTGRTLAPQKRGPKPGGRKTARAGKRQLRAKNG